MNRRLFFSECQWQIMKWSPILGVLGFRYHPYKFGQAAGHSGWVTFFGRLVGFVPK